MSIKLLVLLSLVAVASASPAPILGLPLPTIDLGVILDIGSIDLGAALGSLLKSIIGLKYIARDTVTAILGLKIKDWNSFCDFSIRVVFSLCDTIEAAYKGLGILISKIIIVLLRIIICILGNGGNNPICSNNIHALVGVSVTGTLDIHGLLQAYNLLDPEVQLNIIINIYTKGLGISVCKGSTKVIFQIAIYLVKTIQIVISASGKLTKDHLTAVFEKITLIIGVIGNSRKSGLGISIVRNYLPVCNKYLKSAGYKEIINGDEIATIIDSCNDDNGPWSVSDEDDDNSTSVSVFVSLGRLLKGLLGVTRLAVNIIKEILVFVIRTVEDVFILIIKIILALGGILDCLIAGLGSRLVQIVVGLLKIHLCFLGSSKYAICRPGWDRQFQITVDVTDIDVAIQAYGLVNFRLEVDAYIDAYIKVKGKPTGSVKVFLDVCVALSDICDGRKWDKTVLSIVLKLVITLLGAVGNSNSKGVGTSICNKLVPTLNKYLITEGITVEVDIAIVNSCNDDDYTWTADIDTSDGKTGWIIANVDVSVSIGIIGSAVKGILGLIKGVLILVGDILDAIIIIIIKVLKDVFILIVKLILVLQVILNNLVYGLGNLFVRLVACIIKIAVCVKGCPGDRDICTKEWNKIFGIIGEGSAIAELIVIYQLSRCKEEYNGYVDKCTGGKGIPSTKGSIRTALVKIGLLIEIILKAESISKDTIIEVFIHITTITGCIGNSKKRNSGIEIIRGIYQKCGKQLTDAGYADILISLTAVEAECEKSNDDDCNWDGANYTITSSGGNTTTTA